MIKSITKKCKTCTTCLESVQSVNPVHLSFTIFVELKCYKTNSLCFPTTQVFQLFVKMEEIFRHYSPFLNKFNINWKLYFSTVMKKHVNAVHIPSCHNLYEKIINRFVTFRLRIFNKKRICCRKIYDSKSMHVVNNKKL